MPSLSDLLDQLDAQYREAVGSKPIPTPEVTEVDIELIMDQHFDTEEPFDWSNAVPDVPTPGPTGPTFYPTWIPKPTP